MNNRGIAYVNSQVACALIEMNAMLAENARRQMQGYSQTYIEHDFLALINKYGIHHNAVIGCLSNE